MITNDKKRLGELVELRTHLPYKPEGPKFGPWNPLWRNRNNSQNLSSDLYTVLHVHICIHSTVNTQRHCTHEMGSVEVLSISLKVAGSAAIHETPFVEDDSSTGAECL